ncbi:MAG: trypsin-like serine protease [Bacteroidota bacterium]
MRNKLLLTAFSVIAILAIAVSPVYAITGNFVEDNQHPYVGLVVFYDANGNFLWRCTGTLISNWTVLTAGHCADTEGGAVTARVYFQQDAGANYDPATQVDPVTGYPDYCAAGTEGTLCFTSDTILNYGYPGSLKIPNTHDVGLVILDQEAHLGYAQLPEPNLLDQYATARGTNDLTFTVSGYGLSYKNQVQNGKPNESYRERLMALATLVNLNSALNAGFNLQTQGNGSGKGGTCNGDSGGPVFLGGYDSDLIVAVTSFGLNSLCRGTDFAYRIDQPDVLNWIHENAKF